MRDDNLVITVKDEGIGMTPDQIDQAFNKFYRVDPSDTAVRGLGLGLTICKAIIEAHGGSIWIDSHSGQGTEVHFSLPLQLSSLNQRTKSS
jgi:signal transduction histidine kinase